MLSVLIGINDIRHEIGNQNGVSLERFERMYRMLIQDTLERLPNVKIILCEPFVLEDIATKEAMQRFLEVKEYAKVVKNLQMNTVFISWNYKKILNEKLMNLGLNTILQMVCIPILQGHNL